MSSTRTHRQRWYSSQEGNDIRNPFLVHPPTHPLLPHQHQPHPNAVPPQAQYILQPQHPPSPIFTEPSSPPPFALAHQHPISSSSISAHTPPPPPSSTVHSSSPISTSTSAIRQPIPTRLHHQQALLLLQNDEQQQEQDGPTLFDEAEEEEDEVEKELQLQYDEEKEKKFDFYFGSRGRGKSSEVKQEGAVGVSLDDEVDLFGTSKSKSKSTEEEEVSVSLMKWDKGKVVEKDPLEVRQALVQKKALLAQTNNTQEPKVKGSSSSSSKQAQGEPEAHRPNFLAQDLALGSTLPLDPKRLLPHALAQINKPAPSSHPHLPTPLIEDFYAKSSDLTTAPTPVPTLTSTDPKTQTHSSFTPLPHTLHLPPTAFSSRSCAIACLAAKRLFSSRDARRRALGLEMDGKESGKRSKMSVVEREKLDEGLERRLGGLLGWRV